MREKVIKNNGWYKHGIKGEQKGSNFKREKLKTKLQPQNMYTEKYGKQGVLVGKKVIKHNRGYQHSGEGKQKD